MDGDRYNQSVGPGYSNTDRPISFYQHLTTFSVFWACGFISVLVDFDHFTKVIGDGLAITGSNFSGREYHTLVFILLGIVWCYSFTCLYRLVAVVLEDKMEKGKI